MLKEPKAEQNFNFSISLAYYASLHIVEVGRPYLRADCLTVLRGVEVEPGEGAGRGKLLRGADDHDPLMVGLT